MREYCINTFNKVYDLNYSLKIKEECRNQDINAKNMTNYRELKKEQEKNKKRLNELNDKADDLQNKFFSTDKYDNIIQDLYNEDILDNDDINIIQNNKSKNEEIER